MAVSASAQADPDNNGKALFSSSCGSCHALQAAETNGTVGPNLDNAFAGSRKQGYAESSIENIVLDQIRLGSGPIGTYTDAEHGVEGVTPQTPMPANIVTGQDAIDVAAYVAKYAGTNGYATAGPIGNDGASIFKSAGCAGCHVLKAAGSTGTIGPNLDQLAGALTLAIVVKQVENGGSVMPAFKGKLTAAQIKAVAQYVVFSAGK